MSEPGKPQLDALQGRLCYQFSDLALLKRALTHRSAGKHHNERLEFLGDAVIGLAAAAAFYDLFPDADEGVLSRLRALVVSGHSLAAIAKELDLSSCLILGESERKSGGRHRDSILADTLEALVGAVALDSSPEKALQVASGWLRSAVESASPTDTIDAKTQLQEWCQARGEALPKYTVVEVSGSDHQQSFRVSCRLPSRQCETEASGTSRRRAEKSAAADMLNQVSGQTHD
ncbi:MAG: ribonuclease III [Luminiphilus sp.]|nr:ribonuclease III [Luminiphilus sp.]RZO73847.1 MAG: ribonuclease III [Halieaceae bacterium]CAI8400905.1 MAG: Ribonuclease 3 [Halieaceae bacterium]